MSYEGAARIEQTLRNAFSPSHFEIEDESAQHRGHPGAAGGGGHYRVLIVSEAFRGMNSIQRQRAVYASLGSAVGAEIHALSMRTLTPEEWRERAATAALSRQDQKEQGPTFRTEPTSLGTSRREKLDDFEEVRALGEGEERR